MKRLTTTLDAFFATEAASSLLLLLATFFALLLANSALAPAFSQLLHFPLGPLSLQHWINDGLMAIFFFVIGLETKRELVGGELSSARKAALPLAAALGGMVVPALVYRLFNAAPPSASGWGIPMATDIAFALGVLNLFGKRVPAALKVFLLALAIADDLGAVLVIALFYATRLSVVWLTTAALLVPVLVFALRMGVRRYSIYLLLAALFWVAVWKSGVHATIAGVVLGFLTPDKLSGTRSYSPLKDLHHKLHPWVALGIMPLFALANAGVSLQSLELGLLLRSPVSWGVALGLFVGKPLGIALASWLAVSLGLAALPRGVRWPELLAVGALGGIGFTMALFISGLALPPELAAFSKAGILGGSLASALVGSALLALFYRRPRSS